MYPDSHSIEFDGRTLTVEDAGPPGGFPVLVHCGGGSRHLEPSAVRDARRYELRLISYDRPAYGGSTPMTGRVIADCAPDVEAVLREVRLFFQDRAAAREKFRSEAAEMYNRLSEPEGWLRMWGDRAGTDAAHGQDAANHLASVFQDGWTRGDEGWWDD